MFDTDPRNLVKVSAPFDIDGNTTIEYVDDLMDPPPRNPSTEEGQTLDEAFVALSHEHDVVLAANKKLVAELSQARAKILQLEDQISSGLTVNLLDSSLIKFVDQGALVTGIQDMLTTSLAEKFDGFEREFSSKIGLEIRSENARLVNLYNGLGLDLEFLFSNLGGLF